MTSQEGIVIDALIASSDARVQFRSDPKAFARRVGVDLDENSRAALLSVDWGNDTMMLMRHVTKGCKQ